MNPDIAYCPKCAKEVTVPEGADASVTVRCPLCAHQYSLAEVLDRRPPTLEIIVDDAEPATPPGTPDTGRPSGSSPHPFDPISGEKVSARDLASFDLYQPTSDENENFESPTGQLADPGVQYSSPQKTRGRTRRERNPVVETLKVVIGGLLALPVAQLIFWWGLQQDPIDLGPRTARVAPFLVPEKFHGDPLQNAIDDKRRDRAADGNRQLPDSNLKN